MDELTSKQQNFTCNFLKIGYLISGRFRKWLGGAVAPLPAISGNTKNGCIDIKTIKQQNS